VHAPDDVVDALVGEEGSEARRVERRDGVALDADEERELGVRGALGGGLDQEGRVRLLEVEGGEVGLESAIDTWASWVSEGREEGWLGKEGERGRGTHLLGKEVGLAIARGMLAQPKDLEAAPRGLRHHLGEAVLCVAAELARVGVV
jgi:hypothetical protein